MAKKQCNRAVLSLEVFSSPIALLLILSDISALVRKEPSNEMMPCCCAPHWFMWISASYMNKLIYSYLQWHYQLLAIEYLSPLHIIHVSHQEMRSRYTLDLESKYIPFWWAIEFHVKFDSWYWLQQQSYCIIID